ncbi:WXG100 family type VII secretion target [Rhodococcus sp. H36-A4]|uniref:WXG100 family type VII secretion target n=1 Tax=Rhodococcus sp. H36-A4 TaxID=3004353 RepID=UPI0022B073DA|nr:WXG100 family type VII secretion target [Rhodococcus sp. H36-A4]MCZ4080271.1 WXG100 family type VII secretion target [Rhodococcus sp. H36-A4]
MGDGGTPDGVLSADPEQIAAVGAAAQQLEQTLRNALDAVSRDVDAVRWDGQAALAFRDTWKLFHEDGFRIVDALNSLSVSLSQSASGYDVTEDCSATNIAGHV